MPRYLNRTWKVPQGTPAVSYKEIHSEDRNKTPNPVQNLLPIELKCHKGKVIHNSRLHVQFILLALKLQQAEYKQNKLFQLCSGLQLEKSGLDAVPLCRK